MPFDALVTRRTAASAVDFLAVANRESSGGSITFYRLDSTTGLPSDAPVSGTESSNIPPAVMMLHDSVNLLGAPVGISL